MSTGYVCAGTIQLDTTGRFKWIRFVGQNTYFGASVCNAAKGAIALDKQQNLHCIKPFGSGAVLTSSITALYGNYDLTYSPAGNLLSVKRLPLDSTLTVHHAAIDTNSNKLYVAGSYNLAFGYSHEAFVAACDTARNLIWSDTMYSSVGNGIFTGIVTDNLGHLYLTGLGQGTSAFRGDSVTASCASFVIKTDTAGIPQWMTKYLGTIICGIKGLTLLPGNKIAGIGDIAGQIISDGDTINSYSGEGWNLFFTVLDSGGCVHTLEQIHGNAFYDYGDCIASDRIGNVFIGGEVGDTTWAGSVGYRSHGGNTDFFVMKYGVDCSCTSMPVADYSISRSGMGGATVAFTYTGTASGLDSMRWDFGDGTTSTATSPGHTYTAAGTYHATVNIYSYCGSDMHCMDIYVPCVAAPTSAFTFSGTTATRSFTFTGTATAIDSIVWNFGDGGYAAAGTASHTYTSTGTYTVCATVYNPCGSNSVCHTITVPCIALPVPSFTNSGITSTRSFTYTGTTTALDSVVWHYGDGGRSTGTSGSHTYAAVGAYTVCVLAYTPCGIDLACNTVTITCTSRPAAAFTNTGVTTVNFSYTGTTTGLDSVIWRYGDGGRGTGTTSSHAYAAVGTYTACVVAYNHCGADSTCHTVTIACIARPTASFTNTPVIAGGYTDTFAYTGTTTGPDSVVWNFGDGNHAAGLSAIHTYAIPDTYTVCVYAYNPCGWDSACYTVIIPCDTPHASFIHSYTNPVNYTYTGTTAHVDSVTWNLADFATATGLTASHAYPATGTFMICVYAWGVCAIDTFCDTVHVTGTGLQRLATTELHVYPNPVRDELTITDVSEAMEYRLMDITGRVMQAGSLVKGRNTLHLKNFVPGMYLLEVIGGEGRKIIVPVVKE